MISSKTHLLQVQKVFKHVSQESSSKTNKKQSVEEAMGMIPAKRAVSKYQYKKTIYRRVLRKYN